MARDASLDPSLDLSPRTAARVAGLGLLLMALFAAFANFYVLETLVVAQDAEVTVKNLTAATGLVRLGVVCFLVVAVLDVVVAWGLYALLGPVSRSLSLLAAWFRIVYAAAFALSLNPLLTSVQLLSGADYLSALGPELVQAQVMLSLSTFQSGWQLSLALFGCHLLVLGALVFKSGFLPRWLGFLLGVAGLRLSDRQLRHLLNPRLHGYTLRVHLRRGGLAAALAPLEKRQGLCAEASGAASRGEITSPRRENETSCALRCSGRVSVSRMTRHVT